jgi:hypothetical protein
MSDAMTPTPPAAAPTPSAKPPMKERLKALMEEYGKIAITTYFVIFGLVFAGFAIAIKFGFQPEGGTGTAGLLGAAWLATKATQPFRILGTLALTPVVAKLVGRKS